MSTDDLAKFGIDNIPYHIGFAMHDQLKNKNMPGRPFNILLNLDHEYMGRNGTHWVTLFRPKKTGPVYYYDSFGLPPSDIIRNFVGNVELLYNNSQQQQFNSNSCGLFVLKVLHDVFHNKINPKDAINMLDNHPSDKNELTVRKFMK